MMMTLSIESTTTIPCTSAADATPIQATSIQTTPTVVFDLTALPHPAFAEEQAPFGGLAELVADNAVLGEALQSLVDSSDMPVVCGEARAFAPLQQSPDIVEGGLQPPRATDALDEDKSVVLQAAPAFAAPVGDPVAPVREAGVESVSAVSRVAPIDVSTMFLAAAEEVAAAVMVSPALRRGEAGEIRVQLRPDILEGAEVVVAVDGKKMEVTFVPTVTHVADTLASNQAVAQQQLAARIQGFEVSVGVAQTVATNVAVNVGSERAAQLATTRMRKTNGRT